VSFKERFETEFDDEERALEDDFRFGMTLQKSCKLFANFEKADVIIASPLGLKLILENEYEGSKENHFLSSIEILVIDRANSILM
jgi:U3 small nucleolar RNA-associated protein 25